MFGAVDSIAAGQQYAVVVDWKMAASNTSSSKKTGRLAEDGRFLWTRKC